MFGDSARITLCFDQAETRKVIVDETYDEWEKWVGEQQVENTSITACLVAY